jgi:hypothetical protein
VQYRLEGTDPLVEIPEPAARTERETGLVRRRSTAFFAFPRSHLVVELVEHIPRVEQTLVESTHVAHMQTSRAIDKGLDTVQHVGELSATSVHVAQDDAEADEDEEQTDEEKQH